MISFHFIPEGFTSQENTKQSYNNKKSPIRHSHVGDAEKEENIWSFSHCFQTKGIIQNLRPE